MVVTVAFCMGVISYILYKDMDSESAQTAINMAFIIIGTTVSSYVFGAVWQDKRMVNSAPSIPPSAGDPERD